MGVNMQIALTKKLADAIGVKPAPADDGANPLLSWTANWTNTFDRRKEDMIVMVNNATRFTVTIFGVRRNQLKGIKLKMANAIRNTLLAMNINTEVVDEYMRQAGEVEFCANRDRQLTAWVNRQGIDACLKIGLAVNESDGAIKYNDTMGYLVSGWSVSYGKKSAESYKPSDKMKEALADLTGMPIYKYKAFELLVTLDLSIYKATRRLIVPSDIEFIDFHLLLQHVFHWDNYHLHEFLVFTDKRKKKPAARIVMSDAIQPNGFINEDDLIIVENGHKLSEYLPKFKRMLYIYDFGDYWEHSIDLVRVIEEHDEESPYLLEAVGQTPPDDIGGVGGFIRFREIKLNPDHPEYDEMNDWAFGWSPELREWESKPRIIHY